MNVYYIVFSEDNVNVFDSQVLEYLRCIKSNGEVETCSLFSYRNYRNIFKKKLIENKIKKYVDYYATYSSLPACAMIQLRIQSLKLHRVAAQIGKNNQNNLIICRGDIAAYIGCKNFSKFKNCCVVYDNRGVSIEESIMSHGSSLIHKLNRRVKKKSIEYAKNHADMFNFVTANLREFLINNYGFSSKAPYTIIPTLCSPPKTNDDTIRMITQKNNIDDNTIVFGYIGSLAAWQSIDELIYVVKRIINCNSNSLIMFLTKDHIEINKYFTEDECKRIVLSNVNHSDIPNYLHLMDYGISIRDDSIVNMVAAPTKIAEYLMSGVVLLYKGDIGIIKDMKHIVSSSNIINIGGEDWVEGLHKRHSDFCNDEKIISYFDMNKRQKETINLCKSILNDKTSKEL